MKRKENICPWPKVFTLIFCNLKKYLIEFVLNFHFHLSFSWFYSVDCRKEWRRDLHLKPLKFSAARGDLHWGTQGLQSDLHIEVKKATSDLHSGAQGLRMIYIEVHKGTAEGGKFCFWNFCLQIKLKSAEALKTGKPKILIESDPMSRKIFRKKQACKAGRWDENYQSLTDPYMQKTGDGGDAVPANFLDFPPNFRLRTRF